MHLEQLLSSTTSESIDESLHIVMVALETNAGAVETTRGTSGSLRERWTGRKLSTEALAREEIICLAEPVTYESAVTFIELTTALRFISS